MEDLLACRICLIIDVQLFNLRSSPLDKYFECLIGLNPHNYSFLTQVCAECAFLINKCYMFREKCLRGINVLRDLIGQNGQLKIGDLQSVDRQSSKLVSTVSVGLPDKVYLYHCSSNSSTDTLPLNNTNPIKEETIASDYDKNYSDDDTLSVKLELNDMQDETIRNIELKNVHIKDQKTLIEKYDTSQKARVQEGITIKSDSDTECIGKYWDEKLSELEGKGQLNKVKTEEMQKTIAKIPIKTKPRVRKKKYSLGLKTKRAQTVRSLDREISEYFEVISKSLEEQKAEIKAREHSALYQKAAIKCTVCFKVFVCRTTYELHMKKHDPSAGPVECEVCWIRFQKRCLLNKHSGLHTHKYFCKFCDRVLYNRSNAQCHRKWHLGIKFECKHCLQTFSHRTTYLSHLRIKHPSQHICNLCGYSFLSERGLQAHKVGMHETVTETSLTGPRCDECGLRFADARAFQLHTLHSTNHVDQPLTKAHDMRAGCRSTRHMRSGTSQRPRNTNECSPTVQWPKKCDHCEEMIPGARQNWYHHRREHRNKEYALTPTKPYMCEVCGHQSSNAWFLSNHMRDHHSAHRPYACPHCPKSFGTSQRYKTHVRTHSSEKPFSCSVCSCAFKIKGDLLKHEKTHSGLRPYSCEICGKSFGTSTIRNSHVKYVHLKAPPPVRNRKPAKRKPKAEALGE